MNPFGTYLESVRRSRRMKQCDLAKEIGVNPSYVSAIEGGTKSPPSTPIIQGIVEILGLSKKEEELLWEYAEQSIRVLRIPEDLPLQEYAVVKSLKNAFGSLSEDQIIVVCKVLAMNDNRQEKVHR